MTYLKAQIKTISSKPNLIWYGFFLSLTHLWTFFYWNKNNFFVNSQSSNNAEPICFPFFPDCDLFRQQLSPESWQMVLYAYLITTVITCLAWFRPKNLTVGWILLSFLTLFKLALHLSNYNFMGNYHYMVYVISFVFLFFPAKEVIIKLMIVAFYIAAGFLKINIDWLSGAAMITTPWLHGAVLNLSLIYVLFLELIFVFGLIHPHKWIRRLTLLQFTCFHLFSWHIVGFYYPMVMFSLLFLFYYDEYEQIKNKKTPMTPLMSFLKGQLSFPVYGTLILFIIMQIIPFAITSDPSLSGSARLSSLNMFDSKTHCHSLLVAHKEKSSAHLAGPTKNMGVRLRCDPLVFLNHAYQLCRKNHLNPEIERLSLALFSRRVTSTHYKKVLDIPDVCSIPNPLWAEVTTL